MPRLKETEFQSGDRWGCAVRVAAQGRARRWGLMYVMAVCTTAPSAQALILMTAVDAPV